MRKWTAKEAETIPGVRLLWDIIGPYKIRREDPDDPLILIFETMIDPVTGWPQIVQ